MVFFLSGQALKLLIFFAASLYFIYMYTYIFLVLFKIYLTIQWMNLIDWNNEWETVSSLFLDSVSYPDFILRWAYDLIQECFCFKVFVTNCTVCPGSIDPFFIVTYNIRNRCTDVEWNRWFHLFKAFVFIDAV